MSDELTWTLETVIKCDHCGEPMIPNVSGWEQDEDGEWGCDWNCTTYDCGDWGGSGISAEDLVALGCPAWLAERMEALADAVRELEE